MSRPDLIATMWLYVTDDGDRARHVLRDVLAPLLGRDPEDLGARLRIGSADHCVELLAKYAAAGADHVLIWPVLDPVEQLEIVAERVLPRI